MPPPPAMVDPFTLPPDLGNLPTTDEIMSKVMEKYFSLPDQPIDTVIQSFKDRLRAANDFSGLSMPDPTLEDMVNKFFERLHLAPNSPFALPPDKKVVVTDPKLPALPPAPRNPDDPPPPLDLHKPVKTGEELTFSFARQF